MDLFVRSDLFVAPAAPGNINVTTIFGSASTKVDEDSVPMQWKVVQPVTFLAQNSSLANITGISPLLPGPEP